MIQKCSIWKVFEAFADRPKKHFQIRELAREIKLAHTSVNIHLTELEKMNLVKKEKAGIYKAYIANFDDDGFRFYKKMLNIIKLRESGIVEEIENRTTPDAVILFGSYMKGEDTEKSDIDLFVIAKETTIDVKKYEKELNRKIQLFFAEKIKKLPAELFNNVFNGLILSGFVRWN